MTNLKTSLIFAMILFGFSKIAIADDIGMDYDINARGIISPSAYFNISGDFGNHSWGWISVEITGTPGSLGEITLHDSNYTHAIETIEFRINEKGEYKNHIEWEINTINHFTIGIHNRNMNSSMNFQINGAGVY